MIAVKCSVCGTEVGAKSKRNVRRKAFDSGWKSDRSAGAFTCAACDQAAQK